MKYLVPAVLMAVNAGIFGGCGSSASVTPDAPIAQQNFDAAWDAAVEVLREEYYFQIDRQDRRDGFISTRPEVGKSWFEFWRKDGVTCRDTAESSLQTIYRSAIVTLSPIEGSDLYAIEVEVRVSRSDLPSIQITDTSDAYELFQLSAGKRSEYLVNYGEEMAAAPVQLPNDEKLAARIKADILRRMNKKLQKRG